MSFLPAIRQLTLTSYRNYQHLSIELQTRPVVLTGHNGAGKSNVLEALSLLTPGRGLRQAKLNEISCVSQPTRGWVVSAAVENNAGVNTVGTSYEADKSQRRVIRINENTKRDHSALLDLFSMIWLTPHMDSLFLESSSERRRFFDRLVYAHYPSHADYLTEYQNLMRERLRVLQDHGHQHPWLNGLEQQMAEHAVAIASARRQHLKELSPFFLDDPLFPIAHIEIIGDVEHALQDAPALKVEEGLQNIWAQQRQHDYYSGMTNTGPHRSDFIVHNKLSGLTAIQSSTGEQKILLLSILIAQANWQKNNQGSAPILLLDEVAAHLDPARRDRLFNHLINLESQFWLTGTDSDSFDGLRDLGQFFLIEKGLVKTSNL